MTLGMRLVRGLALGCAILCGSLVGTAGVTIATSGAAMAQSVNSITVEGSRRVDADTIRSYFHPGPGGRLGPGEIDEGLKSLYATGLFADVHINHVGGRLVVTVVENPVINQVAFEGNKKAKDEQLKVEVQSKPRGTLSKPTVQADVQRIVEIYHRSGRFDVSVVPKIIELPNNRVNLVFEIHEGEKTGVKEIRFIGAHHFSSGRLKDVIKTRETNFLSFLQTTDIYDPDRVEADRDLIRRFYLKNGYADVRVLSAVGEYDPAKKGFIITFTIDEGAQYHVGTVDVVSNVHALDPGTLRNKLLIKSGSVYNADLVEKSVEAMTVEAAKHGYAFANVRPRGDRNAQTRTINLAFVVEEGTRAYIERINIRGNTRTRDYVIRREFDIGEGDAYNRALIDRAERRLKNLNFFKSVKITNEPGSAPDRVVINVDVDEQPTGEFSVGGGYSTADGAIAEVSIADRNLMGRGQFAKAAVQYGQYARGFDLSFVEPYLLGYRMSGGIDLFARENLANNYVTSYNTKTMGATARLGFALTEEVSLAPRVSVTWQEIDPAITCTLSQALLPVDNPNHCYMPSMPVQVELSKPVTTALTGYTLAYNTLDNIKAPTSGLYAELRQDVAFESIESVPGISYDNYFLRTQGEVRNYYEVFPDVVGVLKAQAGNITGFGGDTLRMLDHFQMGPNLVRGFAPNGIGPRDLTYFTTQDALGGTMYWGATAEAQTPLYFLPREVGIKLAVFADAGSLWGYDGPTSSPAVPYTATVGLDSPSMIRASVGVGLLWDSPLGPLRFDLAYPLKKYCATATNGVDVCDRTQIFRFSGGGKF
ncbi:MAG TPA: outer membrane protein assembly factor BamA [Pseudolabrys sp.]|nr:outer membrane protein assembly factor BamA [Pseudolabrys sp.]